MAVSCASEFETFTMQSMKRNGKIGLLITD